MTLGDVVEPYSDEELRYREAHRHDGASAHGILRFLATIAARDSDIRTLTMSYQLADSRAAAADAEVARLRRDNEVCKRLWDKKMARVAQLEAALRSLAQTGGCACAMGGNPRCGKCVGCIAVAALKGTP